MFTTKYALPLEASPATQKKHSDVEELPSEKTSMLMISSQDVPIVESQRPELLPLDLQSELHLRSDRTAIAYRKWLRQVGG
jgi:phenylpropionate dioxygenase-like ring-hydroxylating dioxygenase large terminal subunit